MFEGSLFIAHIPNLNTCCCHVCANDMLTRRERFLPFEIDQEVYESVYLQACHLLLALNLDAPPSLPIPWQTAASGVQEDSACHAPSCAASVITSALGASAQLCHVHHAPRVPQDRPHPPE